MQNHEKIETIILTVCEYYHIEWRRLFTMKVFGHAKIARAVVLNLIRDILSTGSPHEFINMEYHLMNSDKPMIMPNDYDSIKKLIQIRINKHSNKQHLT